MKSLIKIVIIFLALTGATFILGNQFNVEFGHKDFWDQHGFFFLFFITLFPRLTLFVSSVPFGGVFWWLGFFIAPRFLVACLSSIAYWNENPVLVIIAWLVCLSGESGEKYVMTQKVSRHRFYSNSDHSNPGPAYSETIDAEFKRKN